MFDNVENGIVGSVVGTGGLVYKPVHGIKAASKPSDDVLAQQQIEYWLDPGWCMTPTDRSKSKVIRERNRMWWWIGAVLMLLGLVGLVTKFPVAGSISIALLLLIVIALFRLVPGKMPAVLKRLMNLAKCPHCGLKLGNFLYADACPHCHEELEHNTKPLLSTPKQDPRRAKPWPVRMFVTLLRFVES